MTREQLMRRAIEMAMDNVGNGEGGPFAALVVKDGAIIGQGVNRVTTDCDPTAHAEVSAIRDACHSLGEFQLCGCEIYTTCEPCPMCLGAIYWARLDRIWYASTRDDAAAAGFDDSLIYREIPLTPADRRIPAQPLLGAEAKSIFDAWTANGEKTPY